MTSYNNASIFIDLKIIWLDIYSKLARFSEDVAIVTSDLD